jgi:hypothetical protein
MPSFTPRYEEFNVLTGPAQIWTKPYIFGTPAALPADTVLLGGLWPSPWRAIGATKEGVTGRFARSVQNITIEEQSTPVDQKTTSAAFTFTAQLSEDTLETIQLAYGGGSIETTAAGAGTKGKKTLVLSEDTEYIAIGFETFAAPREAVEDETPWRRLLIPKASSAAEVETAYRRADGQRLYPVTFTSLVPISACPVVELNADATA